LQLALNFHLRQPSVVLSFHNEAHKAPVYQISAQSRNAWLKLHVYSSSIYFARLISHGRNV